MSKQCAVVGAGVIGGGWAAPRSFSLRRTSAGVRTRTFIALRMLTARSTSRPFVASSPLER